MKKETLWEIYVKKNPTFEGEGNVTLSRSGLKKMFDQAYDKGHEQGVANGRALAALERPKDDSVFGKIFGPR